MIRTLIDDFSYIPKDSIAFSDFKRCVRVMRSSPDIIGLLFGSVDNPCYPVPYTEIDLSKFSSGEMTKIQLVYGVWHGTGYELNITDLLRLDQKDREAIAEFLLSK